MTHITRGVHHRWLLAVVAGSLMVACEPKDDPAKSTVEMWKTSTCQCCVKWAQHLRDNGFNVHVHDASDLNALKTQLGVPRNLATCHTAQVDGYVIEGHVPAEDIRRLLAEKPRATGIGVAGMPIGSPGMEQGATSEPYEVLLFDSQGNTSVFAEHASWRP